MGFTDCTFDTIGRIVSVNYNIVNDCRLYFSSQQRRQISELKVLIIYCHILEQCNDCSLKPVYCALAEIGRCRSVGLMSL